MLAPGVRVRSNNYYSSYENFIGIVVRKSPNTAFWEVQLDIEKDRVFYFKEHELDIIYSKKRIRPLPDWL